jgi:hypothetical protein
VAGQGPGEGLAPRLVLEQTSRIGLPACDRGAGLPQVGDRPGTAGAVTEDVSQNREPAAVRSLGEEAEMVAGVVPEIAGGSDFELMRSVRAYVRARGSSDRLERGATRSWGSPFRWMDSRSTRDLIGSPTRRRRRRTRGRFYRRDGRRRRSADLYGCARRGSLRSSSLMDTLLVPANRDRPPVRSWRLSTAEETRRPRRPPLSRAAIEDARRARSRLERGARARAKVAWSKPERPRVT